MAEVLAFPPSPADLPDADERRKALDIRWSWIVEAPAGSGKTGLLIQRYLKLLTDETVADPSQVLAITFTVKATAELRERVLTLLEGAGKDTVPRGDFERETRPLAEAVLARDRRLGWNLVGNPRRLRIQTIDSLCMNIARSLPVLSGAGGALSPVETEDASEIYRLAACRTLMHLGGADAGLNSALAELLLHRDGNLANCEGLLAEMLGWRDQWGELVPLSRSDLDNAYLDEVVLPKIERALAQIIGQALRRASESIHSGLLHRMASVASELGHLPGHEGAESRFAVCRDLQEPPGIESFELVRWQAIAHLALTADGEWRADRGINGKNLGVDTPSFRPYAPRLKAILSDLREDEAAREALVALRTLPPAAYPQEQWVVAKALFRVLSRALVELQLVFAERGECDFVEMGLLARAALRRDAALDDLAVADGMELRHLLVDEMQDTSTSQYELIQLLTESWDGHSQTVFLVGDPKQSIYLFRQARVERFVQTMIAGQLGEIPLGCLQLRANFRSQASLVDAFNDGFAKMFPPQPNPAKPQEVPFVAAHAVRGPSAGRGEVWHAQAIPPLDDKQQVAALKRDRRERHAREIRKIAEASIARGHSMAVLVSARGHLREIVAEFKRATPIPFRAVKIDALGDRREILDLVTLTRALLHPADRVAWFALLRAPWCGLALADLHRLAGADDPAWAERSVQRLMEARAHEMSDDGCARLERVWTAMSEAMRKRGTMPVAEWVDRTWRSLGADRFATEEELANVRRFLSLLDELEEPGGTVSLSKLGARLGRLHAEPSAQAGTVDLMTIHEAKGLERDVIVVPALERQGRRASRRLLSWMEIDNRSEPGAAHGILAPIASKGGASKQLNEWMRSIENAREAAEMKRLFYVACTRAREELHLFAAPEGKKKGGLSVCAGTLLFAAWPAAERHFATGSAIAFPAPMESEPGEALAIAAATDAGAQLPTIQRFPLAALRSVASAKPTVPEPLYMRFKRSEGSFEARAFGNAVHAALDLLSQELATGETADSVLASLRGWQPRIDALLRASGLASAKVERLTAPVLLALSNTLRDPHGLWVAGPHVQAASEQALVSLDEQHGSVRLDRTFLAGHEPLVAGENVRWIVDYKTATHGREGLDEFLRGEQAQYREQLNAYARAFAEDGLAIRVGLYYPLLPRLVWWEPAPV